MPKYQRIHIPKANHDLAQKFLKNFLQNPGLDPSVQIRVYQGGSGVWQEVNRQVHGTDILTNTDKDFYLIGTRQEDRAYIANNLKDLGQALRDNLIKEGLTTTKEAFIAGSFFSFTVKELDGTENDYTLRVDVFQPGAGYEVPVDLTEAEEETYPIVYSEVYPDQPFYFELFIDQGLIFIPGLTLLADQYLSLHQSKDPNAMRQALNVISILAYRVKSCDRALMVNNKVLSLDTANALQLILFEKEATYKKIRPDLNARLLCYEDLYPTEAEVLTGMKRIASHLGKVSHFPVGQRRALEARLDKVRSDLEEVESRLKSITVSHENENNEHEARSEMRLTLLRRANREEIWTWQAAVQEKERTLAVIESAQQERQNLSAAIGESLGIALNPIQKVLIEALFPEQPSVEEIQVFYHSLKVWVKDLKTMAGIVDENQWLQFLLKYPVEINPSLLSTVIHHLKTIFENIELGIPDKDILIAGLEGFITVLRNPKLMHSWARYTAEVTAFNKVWMNTVQPFLDQSSQKTKKRKIKLEDDELSPVLTSLFQVVRQTERISLERGIELYFKTYDHYKSKYPDLIRSLSPLIDPEFQKKYSASLPENRTKLIAMQVDLSLMDLRLNNIFSLTQDEKTSSVFLLGLLLSLVRETRGITDKKSESYDLLNKICTLLEHWITLCTPTYQIPALVSHPDRATPYQRAVCLCLRDILKNPEKPVFATETTAEQFDQAYQKLTRAEKKQLNEASHLIEPKTDYYPFYYAKQIASLIYTIEDIFEEYDDDEKMRERILYSHKNSITLCGHILQAKNMKYDETAIFDVFRDLLVRVRLMYKSSFYADRLGVMPIMIDRYLTLLNPATSYMRRLRLASKVALIFCNFYINKTMSMTEEGAEIFKSGKVRPYTHEYLELMIQSPPDIRLELQMAHTVAHSKLIASEAMADVVNVNYIVQILNADLKNLFGEYIGSHDQWVVDIMEFYLSFTSGSEASLEETIEKRLKAYKKIFENLRKFDAKKSSDKKHYSPLEIIFYHQLNVTAIPNFQDDTHDILHLLKSLAFLKCIFGVHPHESLVPIFKNPARHSALIQYVYRCFIHFNPYCFPEEYLNKPESVYLCISGMFMDYADAVYEDYEAYTLMLNLFDLTMKEMITSTEERRKVSSVDKVLRLGLNEPHVLGDDNHTHRMIKGYLRDMLTRTYEQTPADIFKEFISNFSSMYDQYFSDPKSCQTYLKALLTVYYQVINSTLPEARRHDYSMKAILIKMKIVDNSGIKSLKVLGVPDTFSSHPSLREDAWRIMNTLENTLAGESSSQGASPSKKKMH